MPGFCFSDKKIEARITNVFQDKSVRDEIVTGRFHFVRNTLNRFMNDKAFEMNEDFFAVVDGVLLNKVDLFAKYECSDVFELCKKMYYQNGNTFFEEFRGTFCGAIFDIKVDKLIAFTNHVGDNPLFYYIGGKDIIVGSEVSYVLSVCRNKGNMLTFDENSAYHMLTFAFMEDNSTYAKEIKRLVAGEYLQIENGRLAVKRYHRFIKNPKRFKGVPIEDIVEEINRVFKRSVKLEYEKDKEYGLRNRADLSGGLDSRMAMWVAHMMGVTDIIQFNTVCLTGDVEEKIARQLASHWNDDICIRPNDNMNFIYDVDIMVRMMGGLSLYMGPTGEFRILQNENTERYGLKHTGQLGDVILGSYAHGDKNNIIWTTGRYSEKLSEKVGEYSEAIQDQYEDMEQYLLYTRGFLGIINTHQFIRNFTEAVSPFMDVDFFQLCMDIPIELRIGHYIYKEWIFQKYPEATKFKWERINDYISNDEEVIKQWRLKREAELKKSEPKKDLDYYYQHNEKVQSYWKEYYDGSVNILKSIASDELCDSCEWLFDHGNVLEKSMVITLLSSVKLYFGV